MVNLKWKNDMLPPFKMILICPIVLPGFFIILSENLSFKLLSACVILSGKDTSFLLEK